MWITEKGDRRLSKLSSLYVCVKEREIFVFLFHVPQDSPSTVPKGVYQVT